MAEKPDTVLRDGKAWPILSAAEMATLCGFSQEMLRRLEKAGVFQKLGRDQYSPPDVLQGVIAYMRDEARRSTKSAEARAVQQARAREIELRIARESGKLIDVDDTEAAFAEILGAWRSELDGIARAVTRDLALREAIDQHINDAAARCRARFTAARERLQKGTK